MSQLRFLRPLAALTAIVLIASCATRDLANPTAPVASGASSLLDGQALKGVLELQLRAVSWTKQIDGELSVTRTIDQAGGTISLPETGLTIEFPAGAVRSPVTITVTPDEKYVAYKMEPAGTQFSKDVRVTQLLDKTSVFGLPLGAGLYAAYIADDNVNLSGILPILELEPSTTIFSLLPPLLPQAEVWTIRHFSRYILASG